MSIGWVDYSGKLHRWDEPPTAEWQCTHCGRIGYATFSVNRYARFLPPAPTGWSRWWVWRPDLGGFLLVACSESCRLELETIYPGYEVWRRSGGILRRIFGGRAPEPMRPYR